MRSLLLGEDVYLSEDVSFKGGSALLSDGEDVAFRGGRPLFR